MNLNLRFKETRYAIYIVVFFVFMGPFDYVTTYYGIYVSEHIQEQNDLVRWAIQNNILAEFILGSTLIVIAGYIFLYYTLSFLSDCTIKHTWYMYETLLVLSVLFSVFVVVKNIVVIVVV